MCAKKKLNIEQEDEEKHIQRRMNKRKEEKGQLA
jgi:hypothetical protein